MKVMRWERNWHAAGHPFHDVTAYPEVSVATSGTHDTETMAEWWDSADLHERQAVLALPDAARLRAVGRGAVLGPHARCPARGAVCVGLTAADSSTPGCHRLARPHQHAGRRQRSNWTWRLPGPVEDLMTDAGALERAGFLRALSTRQGRCRRSGRLSRTFLLVRRL